MFRLSRQNFTGHETPSELVRLGFVDPVRVFIKNEPHKQAKADENRWRLISSVSLIDQVIERLCFRDQNQLEILKHRDIPSKPGMGLHDEGLKELYVSVTSMQYPLAETDVSAWDWSVQAWQLMLDALGRCRLYGLRPTDLRWKLIVNRIYCLTRTVFCTSDGCLLEQTIPGIQLSGSYNTSSTNSRIRVFTALMSGVSEIIAMGDDSVETWTPNIVEKYQSCGHTVKMYKRVEPGLPFEFCSMLFENSWKAYPVNADKMFYKLLSNAGMEWLGRVLLYQQWRYEMRYHPRLPSYDRLLRATSFLEE